MTRSCILIDVLRTPEACLALTPAQWETLISQARVSRLLVRLATRLDETDLLQKTPEAPRQYLIGSLHLRDRQIQAVRWEVAHLERAFEEAEVPLVLLKGAAYVISGAPPGRCRVFSDFDVLVSKDNLRTTELTLMRHGWASASQDAYDQRYYRQWMHELPPMRHLGRSSVIDVHHNLVPETARLKPSPEALLAACVPCPDNPNVFVLNGNDMIIHSAVHLFHDGEFDHALRDLFDIADLVAHFMKTDDDWRLLVERAHALKLAQPLSDATRYLERVLGVSVPAFVTGALEGELPPRPVLVLRDAIFERALMPQHESICDRFSSTARLMLYIRGHALRMPLHLLIPHLVRKALMRSNLLPEPGAAQPGNK